MNEQGDASSVLWRAINELITERLAGWNVNASTVRGTLPSLAAHIAAADPHSVYQLESEEGAANGYASLDASALVPLAQLPGVVRIDKIVTAPVSGGWEIVFTADGEILTTA